MLKRKCGSYNKQPKMGFCELLFGFSSFLIFLIPLVNGLYFTALEVNISVPNWRWLPKPLPPLMKLYAADGQKHDSRDISYGILMESTSGLFIVDRDEIRINEESFTDEEIVSKHQSVIVSGRLGAEFAKAPINLFLTGDKINCERAKRNMCFWNGVSYRIWENQPPTLLGQMSSQLFREICKNYSLTYEVFKGRDHVEVSHVENTNTWMLSTKRKMTNEKTRKIQLGVNCTVVSSENVENFQNEFELMVFEEENLGIFFEPIDNVFASRIIHKNEIIARGVISSPTGENLKFSLKNDTEGLFDLKCLPNTEKTFHKSFNYKCEVTTRKTVHLKSTYTAIVQIEDMSLSPPRFHFQNITLEPIDSGLEKLSLMMSTNAEADFMLDLKYPESIQISRRAVIGTRVAEPMLGRTTANSDIRRRIAMSNIKFEIHSPGVFNVTQTGGIVFVQNRNQLKEALYRIKINGVHPNGHRFISTIQIDVKNAKLGEDICEKLMDENLRSSCSEKRFKSECEKTCGVSSGVLKRSAGKPPTISGCVWRSNEKPEKLSRLYQTCSPDLYTCPDRFCDPLEALFPKICPQDCTEYVFGSANKENHIPGIASATGVCSCDSRQKCLCALITHSDSPKLSEGRNSKKIANETIASRYKEKMSAVKASYTEQCGMVCLLAIMAGSVIFIFGTSIILLIAYRRRLKKRCPNQRPLKEDMVNINYEEYVERPGDILQPLTQMSTVKEIPEYFDKKWEFPRHRLTIEETLGEGEFGKVLKARADGIGGFEGSITVAVKTLKDNAKESELSDLISEYQLLKEIDHPNVIHLLGACTKPNEPLYIIIEYAKHGSLRNYLRKHRHFTSEQLSGKESKAGYIQTITPKDILTFAWQIAKGMNYLTEMKLVHRDLAARNVLVAEDLICKISDFGLTRDIYEDDTYLKRSKGRVPVKWMALESLADHVYTTKSDVWSYGIVLWELVTTGASPYPGIAGQDLFNLLKSGYRMEKPPNCSNELYQILRSCWQENPSHRPNFKSLVAKFEEMLGEGKDYLDLNPRTAENKTYFSEFLGNENEEWEVLRNEQSNGIFALEFKMFENPKQCFKCPVGKCACAAELRYENENIMQKPKYENEGMEDNGYVQPTGKPKPVKECQKCNASLKDKMNNELACDANFNVDSCKKELSDIKKI